MFCAFCKATGGDHRAPLCPYIGHQVYKAANLWDISRGSMVFGINNNENLELAYTLANGYVNLALSLRFPTIDPLVVPNSGGRS